MLQLKTDLPEALPVTTAELLRLLDALVIPAILRPGDNIDQTLYQAGARDLVDMLLRRFSLDRDFHEPADRSWYDSDPDMTKYIEGRW